MVFRINEQVENCKILADIIDLDFKVQKIKRPKKQISVFRSPYIDSFQQLMWIIEKVRMANYYSSGKPDIGQEVTANWGSEDLC